MKKESKAPTEDKIIKDGQGNVWKYIARTGEIILISGTAIITVMYVAPLIEVVGFTAGVTIAIKWCIAGMTGYGAGTIMSNIIIRIKLWKRLFSFNKVKRLKKLRDAMLEEAELNSDCRETCYQMAKIVDEQYQAAKKIQDAEEALKDAMRATRRAKKVNPRRRKSDVEFEEVNIDDTEAATA